MYDIKVLRDDYQRIWELAQPYLNTRRNDIHTEIATQCAYVLLERERGNEDVVIPAILLHDVGWKKVPEDLQMSAFGPKATMPEWNRVHEVEGVKIARSILEEVGYHPEKIEEILEIIGGHDSRKEPISLNDRLVKDADKLWRYSEVAVRINRERFKHTLEQEMDRLGSNLEAWFLTDSGKEIAREEMEKRFRDSKDSDP